MSHKEALANLSLEVGGMSYVARRVSALLTMLAVLLIIASRQNTEVKARATPQKWTRQKSGSLVEHQAVPWFFIIYHENNSDGKVSPKASIYQIVDGKKLSDPVRSVQLNPGTIQELCFMIRGQKNQVVYIQTFLMNYYSPDIQPDGMISGMGYKITLDEKGTRKLLFKMDTRAENKRCSESIILLYPKGIKPENVW